MFEETNQAVTEEMELPEDIFGDMDTDIEDNTNPDDVTAEATESDTTQEDAETEIEQPESDAQPTEAEQKIKVKYNGEEKEITLSEATEYAQKGMNYDHVAGERNEVFDILDAFAKAQGVKRSEYIDFLKQEAKAIDVKKAKAELSAKYTEAPPELLDELAQAKATEVELQRIKQQEAAQNEKQAEQTRAWQTLFTTYPDVKPDTLSQEVYNAVRAGLSPVEAYQTELLKKLKTELEVTKNNKTVKEKAVGSVAGDGAAQDKDPFLDAFNSEW